MLEFKTGIYNIIKYNLQITINILQSSLVIIMSTKIKKCIYVYLIISKIYNFLFIVYDIFICIPL